MYDSHHSDFILSPLRNILEEGILACKSVGDGIETYPLCEYIMQSLFLKMTGAQEQKLKCICWDMATVDYEYRYNFLKSSHGECSNLDEKENVCSSLLKAIWERDRSLDASELLNVKSITEVAKLTEHLYENSCLIVWQSREYASYLKYCYDGINQIVCSNIAVKEEKQPGKISCKVFHDKFKSTYKKVVYNHRNRCAHNTFSYQQNKPDLSKLSAPDYDQCNYFYRFTLLVIIDEIFTKLWRKYIGLYSNTGI